MHLLFISLGEFSRFLIFQYTNPDIFRQVMFFISAPKVQQLGLNHYPTILHSPVSINPSACRYAFWIIS